MPKVSGVIRCKLKARPRLLCHPPHTHQLHSLCKQLQLLKPQYLTIDTGLLKFAVSIERNRILHPNTNTSSIPRSTLHPAPNIEVAYPHAYPHAYRLDSTSNLIGRGLSWWALFFCSIVKLRSETATASTEKPYPLRRYDGVPPGLQVSSGQGPGCARGHRQVGQPCLRRGPPIPARRQPQRWRRSRL